MTNGEISFADFAKMVKDGVEAVGKSFEQPDDDWMPVLFLLDADNQGTWVGIDGRFMASPESKNRLMRDVIKPMIAASGAKKMATVFSAWGVQLDKDEVEERGAPSVPPSKHPDRMEMVMVTCFDSEKVVSYQANIQRDDENPPTLAAWEELPEGMTGRFVDGVQDTLRDSSGRPNERYTEMMNKGEI